MSRPWVFRSDQGIRTCGEFLCLAVLRYAQIPRGHSGFLKTVVGTTLFKPRLMIKSVCVLLSFSLFGYSVQCVLFSFPFFTLLFFFKAELLMSIGFAVLTSSTSCQVRKARSKPGRHDGSECRNEVSNVHVHSQLLKRKFAAKSSIVCVNWNLA